MNTVLEIEKAIQRLPQRERLGIACRILEDYQEDTAGQPQPQASEKPTPPPPDYAARRRLIFGSKVIPNMVIVAREEERW